MTTQKPKRQLQIVYSENPDGSCHYSFGKNIPKKEEKEPLFSVQLGVQVYQSLFKKYLSDEKYRKKVFSEAEGVKNMSLLQMKESFEFVMNKELIKVILKKDSLYFEYLRLDDNVLMLALEGALNELQEVIKRRLDHFLVIEMETFKLAKKQKDY